MTKKTIPPDAGNHGHAALRPCHPAGGGFFEYLLLAACVAVIACRATLTEVPGIATTAADSIFNTATSAFLILATMCWFISNICKKQFAYRLSGIEYGLVIFAVASVIGVSVASNKRAAINDAVMLIAPILMAILLVQILTSSARIKVLLYVIVALGAANAYECFDQYKSGNQMTIDEYQRDPNSMLSRLNIEKGTFQHMLFEHRLYSKDIRGFFTTGNSAGSFFLLALAAAAVLMVEKYKMIKAGAGSSGELLARGLIAALILGGLVLTGSKGAITAVILAVMLYSAYAIIGKRLAKHKSAVIIFFLILIIVGGGGVAWYGSTHGTLPGGKSMLVRWEYWVGAARAYASHPLTGVGPGSFANYYPTYKIPAALETVKDPHNFVLSILAQYGPLGLVGFLAALFVPLGCTIFSNGGSNERQQDGSTFRKMAISFLLLTVAALLAIRPLVLQSEFGDSLKVMLVIIAILYVIPAAIFAAAFLFLSANEKQTRLDRATQAILFCAIAGVLVHNLVDFAIFEPGVYTVLWAMVAAISAMDFNQGRRKEYLLRPSQLWASCGVIVGFSALWAYMFLCVTPVVKSSIKSGIAVSMMQNATSYSSSLSVLPDQSQANIMQGVFDYINRRLYAAADDDTLNPDALSLNARICLDFYSKGGQKDEKLLEWAQNRLLLAIQRDPANFKNYESLAEVLKLLADKVPAVRKNEMLEMAFAAISEAIVRYPGSERLRMEAGRIAEQLGKNDEAFAQYAKAIEIEDSYRIEFAKMYPDRPLFSRMGESEYQFAKKRIQELSPPSR
jgi:hypothetical protein